MRGPTLEVRIWRVGLQMSDYDFIMALDPQNTYSNKAERANWDNNDVFKLTKTLCCVWFVQHYFTLGAEFNTQAEMLTQLPTSDEWKIPEFKKQTTPASATVAVLRLFIDKC